MFLRVLGRVEVAVDGQWHRAGPAKQSAILAALALTPNRPVPQAMLIHRAWGAESPSSSRSGLYSYIARLRRLLAPIPDAAIERADSDGYRLVVPEGAVDLFVMREQAAKAVESARLGDAAASIDHWRRAVGLWRGDPLGLITTSWADRVRKALLREHLENLRELFAAELDGGNHSVIIGELTEFAAAYPQQETLTEQLMRAMYLSGRQVDALALYAEAASRLRREFGVEPGRGLRQMHRRILRHDPQLYPAGSIRPDPLLPRQLPVPPQIVGRADKLEQLNRLYSSYQVDNGVPVLLITGMGGIGKTSLAVTWGHQIASQFPDGQLFCDLGAHSAGPARPVTDVLGQMLRSLGVAGPDIPDGLTDRIGLFRSRTASRRLLVLMDNVADPAEVRALTPTGPGSLVLVTSRHSLSGLVALQGARRLVIDTLSSGASRDLLTELVGSDVVAREFAAVGELITICGGLPLALRIAAARIAGRPSPAITGYVAELRAGTALRSLAMPDYPAAVQSAFEHSYTRLPDHARSVFRCLGVSPGPTVPMGAVAAMSGLPRGEVEQLVRLLCSVHLATQTSRGIELHDLLRQYAGELMDETEKATASRRLLDWYVYSARMASDAFSATGLHLRVPPKPPGLTIPSFTTADESLEWFSQEQANISAVARWAAERDDPAAWLLPDAMRLYLTRVGDLQLRSDLIATALSAARRLGNRTAIAAMKVTLGREAKVRGDQRTAERLMLEALEAAEESPDMAGLVHIDLSELYYRNGKLDDAAEHARKGLSMSVDVGRRQRMIGGNVLGSVCRERGELDRSRELLTELAEGLSGPIRTPALWNLAVTCRDQGDLVAATAHAESALEHAGSYFLARSYVLDVLARIHIERGELESARARAIESYELLRDRNSGLYVPRAMVTMAWCTGAADEADSLAATAASRAAELILPWVETDAHLVRSHAQLTLGRPEEALRSATAALAKSERYGYRVLGARVHCIVSRIHHRLGDRDAAMRHADTALSDFSECGDRVGEGRAMALVAGLRDDAALAERARRMLTDRGAAAAPPLPEPG
ncbi:DNA-binding SARP family transcriptional activator [Stackebrandtia endophytica]|uniref:DNA-binding SARP family transcriptional activator n=1 Tax=Stackebrandtia endophytica TaxID=1496996 RepID=A0A543AVH6_9ACTN|nr:BTAD domain-containing putative transcriptional regulator [Stackebrandtia endophytica]TQL76593.1 DNA-binding SARP family transcriptional activator [Stackebrandtia endophytica]